MKVKKWDPTANSGNGAWVQDYPEVNVSSIVATGTPSSSTFLRGDGSWAVPAGVDNYVNISGDTMTGNLSVSNTAPTIKLLDSNGTAGYHLHANNSSFYILKDTTSDGTYDSIPFILNSSGNVGIGTSAPEYLLHLRSGSNPGVVIENTSNSNKYIVYSRNGTSGTEFSVYDLVAGTDRFGIDGNGLVGINETSPSAQLQVKSGATTRVPLVVDTIASHTGRLQEWYVNNVIKARVENDGGGRFLYVSNLGTVNNSQVSMPDTGTIISRNVADSNSSLTVNLANASATGNIQVWQSAGSSVAWVNKFGSIFGALIANTTSTNNSRVDLTTTGTQIRRNVADANPALIVNQENASSTGDIVQFQKAGTTLAAVSNNGEIRAPKFYLSVDSDGANEIPNWAFSEYNNKPCVSSEYLSDTYYPIYHEGNKPTVSDVTGAQSLQTRYYYDTYGTDALITNGANSTTSWTKTTGTTTPSSTTGPTSPYNNISGFYYTEASGVNNVLHTMILSVPTINNASFMSFGFWWHMYGADMGTLTVSYTTNGSTYIDVWSKTGNQGNVEWQQSEVAIPRLAIGIRINGTTGPQFTSDMCIANMHIDMRV